MSHQWVATEWLARALRGQTPVPLVDLERTPPQPEAIERVSRLLAWRYEMVPVSITVPPHPMMILAVTTSLPTGVTNAIERSSGCVVRMRYASESQIRSALEKYYPNPNRLEKRPEQANDVVALAAWTPVELSLHRESAPIAPGKPAGSRSVYDEDNNE